MAQSGSGITNCDLRGVRDADLEIVRGTFPLRVPERGAHTLEAGPCEFHDATEFAQWQIVT